MNLSQNQLGNLPKSLFALVTQEERAHALAAPAAPGAECDSAVSLCTADATARPLPPPPPRR